MRARDVMSTPVVSVPPEATLEEVVECMTTHRVSGVLVVDQIGRLVGIVSESDILAELEHGEKERILPLGLLHHLTQATGVDRTLRACTAAGIMTTSVITAGPDASLRELLHLMTTDDVNRIPIVENGRVIGVVSRADIIRMMVRHDAAITQDTGRRLRRKRWVDANDRHIGPSGHPDDAHARSSLAR